MPQAAVFVDRDGTINAHAGLISRAEQLHLLPGAGEAIARLNRSDYRAVVVTNQPVIARGDCTTAELRHIHAMMESLLSADGAYLDRLYYCPHHPDSGFCGEIAALKIACSCRKPNIGLIERAVGELNIALERSWMIGDTTSDMLTARRAGLTSILVETGKAGLDGKFGAHPDFITADLLEAVGFILDEYPLLCARCDEIATTILPGQLVFVGGLSRSGKSTLASALHLALHRQGRQAYVVAADRWLLSADHRSPGVLGRYDLAAMTHAAGILADRDRDTPIEVALPTYDRLLRRRTGNIERLVTDRDDVIIIEGTVALHISTSLKQRGPAFFVETDETLRRVRVIREYRLHGCSEAEAEAIYASRQADEAPVILATASLADCRITLPLMSGRHVGSLYSGDGRA